MYIMYVPLKFLSLAVQRSNNCDGENTTLLYEHFMPICQIHQDTYCPALASNLVSRVPIRSSIASIHNHLCSSQFPSAHGSAT